MSAFLELPTPELISINASNERVYHYAGMGLKSTSKIIRIPPNDSSRRVSAYESFVRDIAATTDRNLRLLIDYERFHDLIATQRSLVEYLGLELKLWAITLGRRTVGSVTLFHPFRYLEPFELTRLLHDIASQFRMADAGTKMFTAISSIDDIGPSQLALLKGLGLNCYQIVLEKHQISDLEEIQRKIQHLREFAIENIGIQVRDSDCTGASGQAIQQIQSQCKPDFIGFGNESNVARDNSVQKDFNCEKLDVLQLGPEGNSTIGDIPIQNYHSLDKYHAALDVNRLPIHVSSRV